MGALPSRPSGPHGNPPGASTPGEAGVPPDTPQLCPTLWFRSSQGLQGAGTDPAPPTPSRGARKEPRRPAAKSPSLHRDPSVPFHHGVGTQPTPPHTIIIQQILITTPLLLFPGFPGPCSAELSSSGSKTPFEITGEWRPLQTLCPPGPRRPLRAGTHSTRVPRGSGCHPPR